MRQKFQEKEAFAWDLPHPKVGATMEKALLRILLDLPTENKGMWSEVSLEDPNGSQVRD